VGLVLSQMKPIHTVLPSFMKIHYGSNLPTTLAATFLNIRYYDKKNSAMRATSQFRDLYSSSDVVRMIKARRMRLAGM
jgi:hypothetical protein